MTDNKEKRIGSDIFANILIWFRNVIEEADKPLSLLFLVLLPVIVPITPAWITSKNLVDYMDFPVEMGWVIGVSIEMLGYGGLITLLSVLTTWIKVKTKESLSLVFLIGSGYLVYIISVLAINVILDADAGNRWEHVLVNGLLTVGLSIAAGIFNGYRVTTKEHDDKSEKLRLEERDEKRRRWDVKHGVSSTNTFQSSTSSVDEIQSASTDWRVVRKSLTPNEKSFIANTTDWRVIQKMFEKKFSLSERTCRNWINNAKKELGL